MKIVLHLRHLRIKLFVNHPAKPSPRRSSIIRRESEASSAWNIWRASPEKLKYDKQYTLNKVPNVYNGGVLHEEKQPAHLLILDTAHCRRSRVCARDRLAKVP